MRSQTLKVTYTSPTLAYYLSYVLIWLLESLYLALGQTIDYILQADGSGLYLGEFYPHSFSLDVVQVPFYIFRFLKL